MTGRRSFLKLLTGGAVASQTMSKTQAAKLAGIDVNAVSSLDPPESVGGVGSADQGRDLWRLAEALRDDHYSSQYDERLMPYDIATKKSWGAAFKAHENIREKRILNLATHRIHHDESFKDKIISFLSGKA